MRRWPSGVTVVTMGEGGAMHGLTVSSFASVSLDPPTILVCINNESRAHDMLASSPHFAVNILSAGQRDVSEYFARSRGGSRFEQGAPAPPAPRARQIHPTVQVLSRTLTDQAVLHRPARVVKCPVLEGTAAILECTVSVAVTTGDHVTYFGRVEWMEVSGLDPLLYFDGDYQDVIFGRRQRPRGE